LKSVKTPTKNKEEFSDARQIKTSVGCLEISTGLGRISKSIVVQVAKKHYLKRRHSKG
jgi:hypothetical protein